MTHLVNDPVDFPTELVEGFVRSNWRHVRPVYGGVVRATESKPGKVAVITGGGLGHYPGFMGWVGPGLADGAVTGKVFASPAAARAHSVAKAADHGGGILIAFLNYSGDALQFGMAAELLKADGFDVRTAVVTDDIASAPPTEAAKRRGIAGGLAVLKVTSAAAEAGLSLDDVTAICNRANSRTRTCGIAFSGCTLPGASEPLFEVPNGKMAVGLGVHGEPGIYETDLGTADDVAQLLVDKLLSDVPEGAGKRVVALLNGLGSAKYEELFVTFASVSAKLEDAGLEIVDGQVGEFMTSLDMGGLSLTLMWVDDELESLWLAPCDSPAFSRPALMDPPLDASVTFNTDPEPLTVSRQGSQVSQAAAAQIAAALARITDVLNENEIRLGNLDAVAGDGDHGAGMARGSAAAADAAQALVSQGAGVQTTLAGAGLRWSEQSGGASGALWGAALTAAGNFLGDERAVDSAAVIGAVRAFAGSITSLGGAQVGDKTIVDSLEPFADVLEQSILAGEQLSDAWAKASNAAEKAAADTAHLVPRMGRARVLGNKSVGSPDPGAVSFALAAAAVVDDSTP
jgi:dihydroxyacetone kinase